MFKMCLAVSNGNEGKIILDLNEEQKQHMKVEDLLAQFEKASGRELANDRMLLA